jgi:hypothetical protein
LHNRLGAPGVAERVACGILRFLGTPVPQPRTVEGTRRVARP